MCTWIPMYILFIVIILRQVCESGPWSKMWLKPRWYLPLVELWWLRKKRTMLCATCLLLTSLTGGFKSWYQISILSIFTIITLRQNHLVIPHLQSGWPTVQSVLLHYCQLSPVGIRLLLRIWCQGTVKHDTQKSWYVTNTTIRKTPSISNYYFNEITCPLCTL